ncbi:MAG: N-acetylmuramoyl-L-alanine amidase [Bacteroidota bacterium]
MIEIKDHKLIGVSGGPEVSFEESPNHSEPFPADLPDTIVIHYTAGSSLRSSVNWLKNPRAKASAHLVVGRTGNIVQLVPFNIKAWHAGQSRWKNRTGLNHYSIGIEIDNAGMLEKRADGYYTYFGKRIDNSQAVLATHKHQNTETPWEAFTQKQLETVEMLCMELKEQYNIREITGHDDIAPGRKTDPGPAFPLKSVRDRILLGRKEDEQETEEKPEAITAGIVTADYLNIRAQPGAEATTISDPLPKGTKLKILEQKNDWIRVQVDMEGWVSKRWVKAVR